MIVNKSFSPQEAVNQGYLVVADTAIIAADVRIVPFEDNGECTGVINIGSHSKIREGSILCSGVNIGSHTIIGHNCVVRRQVRIGDSTVVSHMVCLEKEASVGDRVRVSTLTHLTGGCLIEDDVQVGARVVTIDDNELRWRFEPILVAPKLRKGSRVGSGVTLLAGVEIGRNTIVGAGSVVTKNLPANVVAYGNPAYIQRDLLPEEYIL